MEKEIGVVSHYFDKLQVAVVKLSGSLKIGDMIRIETKDGDFTQRVESMEIEHASIQETKKGDEVGMKAQQPVKAGNPVFLQV